MTVKSKTVQKSFKIGYSIHKKRALMSLLLAAVITVAAQWNDVSQMIPPLSEPTLKICLERRAIHFDESDIFKLIELRKYVPNYDAEIYMKVLSENVRIGNDVSFKISIVDSGIVKLQKPYFYIVLIAPSGQVISVFPEIYHISAYDKMPEWETQNYQSFHDCLRIEVEGEMFCIPRKTLVDGTKVIYKFEINNEPEWIGRWKIYVFLYDEAYVDRFGNSLDSNNFVCYSFTEFDTRPKSEPDQIPVAKITYILVPFIVTFIFTYWGIYLQIERNKAKLMNILRKLREHWLFILCIVMIVIAQLWFFLI